MVELIDTQIASEYESHHEEPNTSGRNLGTFNDDYPTEDKTQVWIDNEESHVNHCNSSPLEIQILMPPPIEDDYIYENPIWLNYPPPPFVTFFYAHQVYEPVTNQVESSS